MQDRNLGGNPLVCAKAYKRHFTLDLHCLNQGVGYRPIYTFIVNIASDKKMKGKTRVNCTWEAKRRSSPLQ
jgi:hypothetical protein